MIETQELAGKVNGSSNGLHGPTITVEIPPHIRALKNRRILPYMEGLDIDKPSIIEYVDKYTDQAISVARAGEMIAFYGPPKSRKTTAMYGLAAAAFSDNIDYTLGFRINDFTPGEDTMLFLDTEQSLERTYMRQRVFYDMIGCKAMSLEESEAKLAEMGYHCYNVRPFTPDQRVDQIKYLMDEIKPKLIFIDQIGDLAYGYNDSTSALDLMTEIDFLLEKHKSVLVTDIHTNRGGKESLGTLGSYLDKKVVNAMILSFDEESSITTVRNKYSRDKPIPEFQFQHRPDGRTVLTDVKSRMEFDHYGESEGGGSFSGFLSS